MRKWWLIHDQAGVTLLISFAYSHIIDIAQKVTLADRRKGLRMIRLPVWCE